MARRAKDDPGAPELSLPRIVGAAVELLDADGLDAFSLRALARHLGAGNMSIYHYVQDREELLTLVLDEVFGMVSVEQLPDDPIDALAVLSTRFVSAFVDHESAIPLFVLQPIYSVGPNALAVFDRFVGLLRRTGLSDEAVATATVVLVEYLCGHLTGYLPHVRPRDRSRDAAVDEVLGALPVASAPNIHAVSASLRIAATTLQPAAGIELILDGLRRGGTGMTGTSSS